MADKGNSFANGASTHNGPFAPGKRAEWGMPPPPVTSWSLTGWETPE